MITKAPLIAWYKRLSQIEKKVLLPIIIIIGTIVPTVIYTNLEAKKANLSIYKSFQKEQMFNFAKSLSFEFVIENVSGKVSLDSKGVQREFRSIANIPNSVSSEFKCYSCQKNIVIKKEVGVSKLYDLSVYFNKDIEPSITPSSDDFGVLNIAFNSSPDMDKVETAAFGQLIVTIIAFFVILYLMKKALESSVIVPVKKVNKLVVNLLEESDKTKKNYREFTPIDEIQSDERLFGDLVKNINKLQQNHKALYKEQLLDKQRISEELKNTQKERKKQSQLIIALSHDINQPIQTLRAALQASKKWFYQEEDVQKKSDLFRLYVYINSLSQKAKNILDTEVYLTNKGSPMLSASKRMGMEEVTLYELFCSTDSIALYPFEAQSKDIEFYVDFNGYENCLIRINKIKFERVIANLCSNSIVHTPRWGKITVRIDYVDSNKNELGVSVKDNGVGIPDSFLSKLNAGVDENYKNPNSETSVGFGILNCHRFLKEEGGRLSFESELGVGTIVRASFGMIFVEKKKISRSKKALYFGIDYTKVKPLVEGYYCVDLVQANKSLSIDDFKGIDFVILHDAFHVISNQFSIHYNNVEKDKLALILKMQKNMDVKLIVLQSSYSLIHAEKKSYMSDVKSLPELYLTDLKGSRNESQLVLSSQEKKFFAGKVIYIVDDAHEYALMLKNQVMEAVFPEKVSIRVFFNKNEVLGSFSKVSGDGGNVDYVIIDRMLGEDQGEDVALEIKSSCARAGLKEPVCVGLSAAEHKQNDFKKFDYFYIKEPSVIYKAMKKILQQG